MKNQNQCKNIENHSLLRFVKGLRSTIIILTLAVGFGLNSCKDWLDLRPSGEVVLEEFWQSESDAESVLAACYKSCTQTDYMDRVIVWGEARSDNLGSWNTYDPALTRILENDILPSNGFTAWGAFYRTINYCNTFLYFAPRVLERDQNFSVGRLHSLESEVLTIRALTYFYLVRSFKEVPWISEASVDDTQDYNVKKSTERAVLDSIISDLKYAKRYARINFEEDEIYNKGRITLNAVRALLADIYLWDGQYDLCVNECNDILADDKLELVSGEELLFQVFYRGNSTESIFELQFDQNSRNIAVEDYYGVYPYLGQLSMPEFLAEGSSYSPFDYAAPGANESEDDYRYKDFIRPLSGLFRIFKYPGAIRTENSEGNSTYSWRTSTPNWIVYRLADVILMKAEALVQLNRGENDLREALKMVNTTYLRANPDLGTDSLKFSYYSDTKAMEDLVLRERHRELIFEGKRWYDLVRAARRANSTAPVIALISPKFTGSGGLEGDKLSLLDALYMPINAGELKANPELEQNEFYKTLTEGSN